MKGFAFLSTLAVDRVSCRPTLAAAVVNNNINKSTNNLRRERLKKTRTNGLREGECGEREN